MRSPQASPKWFGPPGKKTLVLAQLGDVDSWVRIAVNSWAELMHDELLKPPDTGQDIYDYEINKHGGGHDFPK